MADILNRITGVNTTRRRFLSLTATTAVALTLPLLATSAIAASDEIYTSLFSSIAAGGYDVVGYFDKNKPVKGKDKFSIKHKGATWLFSSQENLELFTANPAMYEPQYGGYCAYAVAIGETAKGDPLQWDITDNKLYLNINKKIKKKWLSNKDNYISSGDSNWPTVLSK